jgi:predicted negative regulator of RcsB-dependent stress response
MVKKKTKEEFKKKDILIAAVESVYTFFQKNLKLCIIAAVILAVVSLSVYGYAAYEEKKDKSAQILLFQGVKNLDEYAASGKKENLDKAEEIFQKVVQQKQGKIYKIAKLYLGTVYSIKGQTEDARKLYQELSKDSPTVLKMLSEKALGNLDNK